MGMGIQPGVLFIGTVREEERKVIKKILEGAKEAGYTKIVEPCCGAFALSRIALEVGYKAEDMDASDVSLFSAVIGRYLNGKSCKELNVKARGFDGCDLTDAPTILWAQNVLRNSMNGTFYYTTQILQEMYESKERQIESIRKVLDEYKAKLKGIKYRELDLFEHVKEYVEDDKAVLLIGLPTYKAGYEKFFSSGDRLSWKEPEYGIFDPETGRELLMKKTLGKAKCLVLCYEETEAGGCGGEPVFVRAGTRDGANTYITTNRKKEALKYLGKVCGTRKEEMEMVPLKYDLMTEEHEITWKSKIEVVRIESKNALYYRRLFTHNFAGSVSAGNAYAVIIDGLLAGVFGYDSMLADLMKEAIPGRLGVWLSFSMCPSNEKYRLGRLNTMLAMSEAVFKNGLSSIVAEKTNLLLTTMITKHPENKQMRGLMTLYRKDKKGVQGYKLYYKTDIVNQTIRETFVKWLEKEKQYKKLKE